MKNKNGYYSWIHQLNSAVVQSNQIGKKMLAEAKGEKGFDSIASGLAAEYPRDVRIDRKDVGKSSQQIFDQLRAEKEALGTLHKLSAEGLAALTPKAATSQNTTSAPVLPKSTKRTTIDLNNDGVVNDTDAHIDDMDAQPGDNNSSFSDATPSRLPSYLLAAQARLEAGHGLPGDEERVRQHELGQEEKSYDEDEEARRDLGLPPGSGEGPRSRLGESVTSKIKRLMNEESDEGMSMDKATPQTTSLRGSVEGLEPPVGIFRALKGSDRHSEREKIRHLLSIVQTPENHPEHYVSYAHNFFQNMSRFLNKP